MDWNWVNKLDSKNKNMNMQYTQYVRNVYIYIYIKTLGVYIYIYLIYTYIYICRIYTEYIGRSTEIHNYLSRFPSSGVDRSTLRACRQIGRCCLLGCLSQLVWRDWVKRMPKAQRLCGISDQEHMIEGGNRHAVSCICYICCWFSSFSGCI